MSRILVCSDGGGWAIDDLVESKQKYQPHHTFKTEYVHPRDAGEEHIQEAFVKSVKDFDPDIIHFEYFRIGTQILKAKPELQDYKIVITHHNQKPKCLDYENWNEIGVDKLVTHTNEAATKLIQNGYTNVDVIKHGIDLDFFKYSDNEPDKFTVGYAGRIVPWKNLGKIAKACRKAGVRLLFMGKQDKPEYWNDIPQEDKEVINFSYMECDDEERWDFYRDLSCYVQFADPEYESGPLPYFEAMASGVPVITTPTGSPEDLATHEKDALIVNHGDVDGLQNAIEQLRDNPDLRNKLRNNGWEIAKRHSEERMAWEHSKLYNDVIFGESEPQVSVVVPAYNRHEQVEEILESLKEQTYDNFEVIVSDDGSEEPLEPLVHNFRQENPGMTLKIVRTNSGILRDNGEDVYGLAKARNKAICSADGEYLMFLDSRLKANETAISEFVSNAEMVDNDNIWYFGNKGGGKKDFVENFSFVKKESLVTAGMFNERVNRYGGMSQELRHRWRGQGNRFEFVKDAKAEEIKTASSKDAEKRRDISKIKFKLRRLYD